MTGHGYYSKLASRALQAISEDKSGAGARGAVQRLLKEISEDEDWALKKALGKLLSPAGAPEPTAVGLWEAWRIRDEWQQTLFAALTPPADVDSRTMEERIAVAANLAARIECFSDPAWDHDVASLCQKLAPQARTPPRGRAPWRDFLVAELPAEHPAPAPPSALQPRGLTTQALALIRSHGQALARRVGADLTRAARVRQVFREYGLLNSAGQPSVGPKDWESCLEGRSLPKGFKNEDGWPAAAAGGSLAASLASELDYPPSVWALERELEWIDKARNARGKADQDAAASKNAPSGDAGGSGGAPGANPPSNRGAGTTVPTNPRDEAWSRELLGLAFSGGGIRSATFNLGVLQGLAKLGMLSCFDYLSTVSGGGCIGTWWISWIRHAGANGTREVEKRLSPRDSPDPNDPRLRPIRFLRQFSNYLTPRKGLLSADTWVMGVVWARNTLLNLLVLVPALLSILFLPRALEVWAKWSGSQKAPTWPISLGWLVCAALGIVAVVLVAASLYGYRCQKGDVSPAPATARHGRFERQRWIRLAIVFFIFAAAWGAIIELQGDAKARGVCWAFGFSVLSALVLMLSTNFPRCFAALRKEKKWARLLGWGLLFLYVCILGAAAGLLAWGLELVFAAWRSSAEGAAAGGAAAVWGVPLVVLAVWLEVVLLIGLMGRSLPDSARKWLSRLQAYLAMYSLVWAVWVGVSVYGARLDDKLWTLASSYAKWPLIAGWLWTTAKGVFAGRDPRTSGEQPGAWKTKLGFYATVGPYVFIAGLLLVLACVADSGFRTLAKFFQSAAPWTWLHCHPYAWAALLGSAALMALALGLSWAVDVNEFSMNLFYRNRLVRCYLGATNTDRRPNPFTGFDPQDDDYSLASFKHDGARAGSCVETSDYAGPYPIYNATLNFTHGEELAWQERKAASFIFAPALCGYETPWNPASDPRAFRNLQFLGYRETEKYAFPQPGMHLGTPMSISGAALSPNMGFYTRPATAFLMTIFDVRLGWWLGNPRQRERWRKAGPTLGLVYLVKELLGFADDRAGFVYLSDGGHFENLGIYELVRRRCRYIVVCDADEDPDYKFSGLGNAIRKCREDFGAEIKLNVSRIRPVPTTALALTHCAVGTIQYPEQPGLGYLVYLKTSLVGDEPEDLLAYRAQNPLFPQQSTADQWFDESQFESYRRLGLHIATTAFHRVIESSPDFCAHKREFFLQMRDNWYPPSDAILKNFTRHASAYDALIHEMRSDADLRQLDLVVFPRPGAAPVRTLEETPQPGKAFLFFVSLIQLMENVYLDLDLDTTADHPHNAGWIEIFRTWSRAPVFQQAWARCGWTFSRNFRSFCHRRFSLPAS